MKADIVINNMKEFKDLAERVEEKMAEFVEAVEELERFKLDVDYKEKPTKTIPTKKHNSINCSTKARQ